MTTLVDTKTTSLGVRWEDTPSECFPYNVFQIIQNLLEHFLAQLCINQFLYGERKLTVHVTWAVLNFLSFY